jgi:hypothetical protein
MAVVAAAGSTNQRQRGFAAQVAMYYVIALTQLPQFVAIPLSGQKSTS